jgi:hypothetical protein
MALTGVVWIRAVCLSTGAVSDLHKEIMLVGKAKGTRPLEKVTDVRIIPKWKPVATSGKMITKLLVLYKVGN